jgi:hypothetical protein
MRPPGKSLSDSSSSGGIPRSARWTAALNPAMPAPITTTGKAAGFCSFAIVLFPILLLSRGGPRRYSSAQARFVM